MTAGKKYAIDTVHTAVPFDRYVKYTQNTAEILVGYGLWDTAYGGPFEFQVYAADPVNQQVAALVMMKLGKALSLVPNTCEGQITAGVWGYISEIRNRRLLVIDEQKGLAVGFSNLYHDSKLKDMKLYGIPGVDSDPAFQGTFNMSAIHFFKIRKGKIYDTEATGLVLPYGAKTGWE